jgi:hypothetical protein
VKQRPKAAQPICPPSASAKGFTMGRGRGLPPTNPSAPGAAPPLVSIVLFAIQVLS